MARILKANISFLSLCPKGMTGLRTLYKADDKRVEFETLLKATDAFDEQGELLAVVWAPNHVDKEGDYAEAPVIKQMAYDYMRNAGKIDVRHNGVALASDRAHVAETFIIQKEDPRFQNWKDYNDKAVDVAGGWGVVLKIDDKALRKEYREGKWSGISMFGPAEVAVEKDPVRKQDDTNESFVVRCLRKLFGRNEPTEDLDMTEDDVKALLKKSEDRILAAIAGNGKKPKKVAKEDDDTEEDVDINDAKALRKRARDLEKAQRRSGNDELDVDDAEALRARADKLEKEDDEDDLDVNDADQLRARADLLEKEDGDEDDQDDEHVDEDAGKSKKQLAKELKTTKELLRKDGGKSRQVVPANKGKRQMVAGRRLSKEDQDACQLGMEIGDEINRQNGYAVPKAAQN